MQSSSSSSSNSSSSRYILKTKTFYISLSSQLTEWGDWYGFYLTVLKCYVIYL